MLEEIEKYIDRQEKLINQRRDEQEKLENTWQEFLERERYLTIEKRAEIKNCLRTFIFILEKITSLLFLASLP